MDVMAMICGLYTNVNISLMTEQKEVNGKLMNDSVTQ